mmetsp:Transcript_29321/g.68991  ORF Transcript_29321/g.68991 Transcript_29321/m.68991 type:complete len:228 (-) Transcript_29321:441-1124(-)
MPPQVALAAKRPQILASSSLVLLLEPASTVHCVPRMDAILWPLAAAGKTGFSPPDPPKHCVPHLLSLLCEDLPRVRSPIHQNLDAYSREDGLQLESLWSHSRPLVPPVALELSVASTSPVVASVVAVLVACDLSIKPWRVHRSQVACEASRFPQYPCVGPLRAGSQGLRQIEGLRHFGAKCRPGRGFSETGVVRLQDSERWESPASGPVVAVKGGLLGDLGVSRPPP